MSYPKYLLKVSTILGYVHVFKHSRDSWIVQAKLNGEERSTDFFEDLFDVADRALSKIKVIGGERQIPVEPGLRLIHRFNDWLEEKDKG